MRFLESAGYRTLARNWRAGRRELDIVALRDGIVAFVEVKTRMPGPEEPLESLTPRQRRGLRRAAEAWIHSHPGVGREFRFDLIAVQAGGGGTPRIEHVTNAFFGDDAF